MCARPSPDCTPPARAIEEVQERAGVGVPDRCIGIGDVRTPFGARDGHEASQICVISRKDRDVDRVPRGQGGLQRSAVVHAHSASAEVQSQRTGTSHPILDRRRMPSAAIERLCHDVRHRAGDVAIVDPYLDRCSWRLHG